MGRDVDASIRQQELNLEAQAVALRARILQRTSEPASQRLALVATFITELEASPAGQLVARRALVVLRGLRSDLESQARAN